MKRDIRHAMMIRYNQKEYGEGFPDPDLKFILRENKLFAYGYGSAGVLTRTIYQLDKKHKRITKTLGYYEKSVRDKNWKDVK